MSHYDTIISLRLEIKGIWSRTRRVVHKVVHYGNNVYTLDQGGQLVRDTELGKPSPTVEDPKNFYHCTVYAAPEHEDLAREALKQHAKAHFANIMGEASKSMKTVDSTIFETKSTARKS